MNIRPATAKDHDAIWDILKPVFRAGTTYAIARDIKRDAALKLWCDQPAATYVAIDQTGIVGTFYIKSNAAGGGAHVCNCGYVTAAEASGKGVARAMCLHSQAEAAKLGYQAMQFNLVLASNLAAVALWHKLGFDTIGVLPKVFEHPEHGLVDAHVMYKWLGKKGD